MQVTFTGNFVKPLRFKKIEQNGNLLPHRASLVEINPNSDRDYTTIEKTYKEWDKVSYLELIQDTANFMHRYKDDSKERKIFVVTNQKRNFYDLNSKDILAEFMVFNSPTKNTTHIEAIQVKPEAQFSSPKRSYKNIGSAILESIKHMYPQRRIELFSDKNVISFYEKNGFTKNKKSPTNYFFENK